MKTCIICQCSFTPISNFQRRCNNCMILECIQCRILFRVKNGQYKHKFCSPRCRYDYMKGKPLAVNINGQMGNKPKNGANKSCILCGNLFYVSRIRLYTAKYCSKKCWSKRNPPTKHCCIFCNTEFYERVSAKKLYCSWRCRNLHKRELLKGSGSHFWKGGRTKASQIERGKAKYNEWRITVLKRDNYTCRSCGIRNGLGKKILLNAHHIRSFADHEELRYDPNNGITLCVECHQKQHHHILNIPKLTKHVAKKVMEAHLYGRAEINLSRIDQWV